MSRFMKLIAGVAATGLLSLSTAAAAAPAANSAAPLSVARHSTAPTHASRLGAAVPSTTLISIGILAVLSATVLLVAGGDDSDDSDSN